MKINAPLLVIFIVSLVVVGYGIKSTFFEEGSFLTTSTFKADKVNRLEAAGTDLRVYEFTPQTAPTKQCVFVAGDKKAGLTCFDKQ